MEQTDPGAAEDGQNGQQRRRDQKNGRGGGIDVLKAVRFLAAADDDRLTDADRLDTADKAA